jgi:uncharacterized LabA/DUF88 family protein
MFKPASERIEKLAALYPEKIRELERVFEKRTNVYIDYANVRGWAYRLGWHVDIKRLKQLLNSFDTVHGVKFYHGTMKDRPESEMTITTAREMGYIVRTKPVKMRQLSIDVSGIATNSTDILKSFIRPSLLAKLSGGAIELLNGELRTLNQQGILYLEEPKSNFDVEIGRDMLRDYDTQKNVEHFMLWSGDSDFEDPVTQLLKDQKKVIVCAIAKTVASEMNILRPKGLVIFDVKKLREFICYKREITLLSQG